MRPGRFKAMPRGWAAAQTGSQPRSPPACAPAAPASPLPSPLLTHSTPCAAFGGFVKRCDAAAPAGQPQPFTGQCWASSLDDGFWRTLMTACNHAKLIKLARNLDPAYAGAVEDGIGPDDVGEFSEVQLPYADILRMKFELPSGECT